MTTSNTIRALRLKLARDYLAIREARKLRGMAGNIAIANRQAQLAETRVMLRAIRQAGCIDPVSPVYSIERERAIQIRADKRDPNRAVAHVKRNVNGKLVKIDIAAGFCRNDGHDLPLARRWMDNAGARAMLATLEAGQHRAVMCDAVDSAIASVEGASDVVKALLSATKQNAATVAARAGSLHASRTQSAMIRAELDEARAMAALSGKAKRKLRDQLRAAKYAAR